MLLGPSGCGKTTLLSCLAGLLTPTSGSITFGGTEVTGLRGPALSTYRRHTVGVVFQAFNLIPSLSARANVMVPLRLAGVRAVPPGSGPTPSWTQVGLGERGHHRPDQLSGGQQQRVAIARALVHDPPLVLADEPTAHLDYIQVEGILRLLRGIAAPGRMVIVATHDDRITQLADQVVELVPHLPDIERQPARSSCPPGRSSSVRATPATWCTWSSPARSRSTARWPTGPRNTCPGRAGQLLRRARSHAELAEERIGPGPLRCGDDRLLGAPVPEPPPRQSATHPLTRATPRSPSLDHWIPMGRPLGPGGTTSSGIQPPGPCPAAAVPIRAASGVEFAPMAASKRPWLAALLIVVGLFFSGLLPRPPLVAGRPGEPQSPGWGAPVARTAPPLLAARTGEHAVGCRQVGSSNAR